MPSANKFARENQTTRTKTPLASAAAPWRLDAFVDPPDVNFYDFAFASKSHEHDPRPQATVDIWSTRKVISRNAQLPADCSRRISNNIVELDEKTDRRRLPPDVSSRRVTARSSCVYLRAA